MEHPANAQHVSDKDWSMLSLRRPELDILAESQGLRSTARTVDVPTGTVLPPNGMYAVLEGSVRLELNGEVLCTAGPSDYFYEEHLVIDEVIEELSATAAERSRVLYLPRESWSRLSDESQRAVTARLYGDLLTTYLHEFQQPINCCNITAAALSISALGFKSDVNDFFKSCSLPVSYVVDEGMTLGELYDVASSYVYAKGLRDELGIELYYFDSPITTADDLRGAIEESNRVGRDSDILVANFVTGIAHARPDWTGGHFAVIAKCNQTTGLVHMIDVDTEKYGKMWVTSIERLYAAMAACDQSSMRSRGLLRFIRKRDIDQRIGVLAKSPCYPVNCTQYIDLTPEKRRLIFSRSTTNLNSLHVLSMGIGVLHNYAVDVDQIMEAANLSYIESLSFETTANRLARIASDFLDSARLADVDIQYQSCASTQQADREAWFKSQLLTVARNESFLMMNIDYNEVLGYEAIQTPESDRFDSPKLREFWCICVDYIYEQDAVILANMSAATSQIWRAPRANVFRGLKESQPLGLLSLKKRDPADNPQSFNYIISHHKLVLFYCDDDPWSYMLKSVLANIGVTDLHRVDVTGFDMQAILMRKQLAVHSGKERAPYLYFNGNCLGEVDDVITMVKQGTLQEMLQREGLPVLMRSETPSLDRNIYSYPKGGLTEPRNGRHNVLLCACGSSAADKIPTLVEMLVDAGHNVKLLPTRPAETFFKDIGTQRILAKLRPSDIYRDDDEWNFRYTEFGMPIRAAHLALCDWADCVIVAPITCNSMGKIAHGVADNLLSSVFVAWQYQRKPVIVCPACNTNMWNNLTTQDNVAKLKRLGAHIEGPRSGMLSNGRVGTGMMATPDDIMRALDQAFEDLNDPARIVMRWGRAAAASNEDREWHRIYRAIDEGVVGINIIDDDNGDSLLHYAAGGEGEVGESGLERGVPDLVPMRELIKRGINVNIRNDYYFSALHVAVMNDSVEAVRILLEAGSECAADCLALLERAEASPQVRQCLTQWASQHGVTSTSSSSEAPYIDDRSEQCELYFAYGSLKRGFPNHEQHAEILSDFVGVAKTRQSYPLVVPNEAKCSNPNCPYLHRMGSLVDLRGRGNRIRGEVFRIRMDDIAALDKLEGFLGDNRADNVYERKRITVLLEDRIVEAFAYFIADAGAQLEAVDAGRAQMVKDYTKEMARGPRKPGM